MPVPSKRDSIATRAADILGQDDLRREKVWVEQWGTHVHLQELGGGDAAVIMQRIDELGEKARWTPEEMVQVLSNAMIDADGVKLMRTDDDKEKLKNKSWHALMFLFNKIIILGAIGPGGVAREKKD